MSYNIFFTEVDKNLQAELNARGRAGFRDRGNASLDYMLGKVANVQVTAFEGSGSNSPVVKAGILGGTQPRTSRFTPGEFLSDPEYSVDQIKYYKSETERQFANATDAEAASQAKSINDQAYVDTKTVSDISRRVGPYITDATINIGDHSFGLLNKASISIVIPNPDRDLDIMEDIFFRPGRFCRIDVEHPENAVITRNNDTGGLLTENVIPNDEKLKELYPGLLEEKIDNLKSEIRRINAFRFEGLITNFNFSYTEDASINATIQLTGTSNVYTDVSMFQNSEQTKEEKEAAPKQATPEGTPVINTEVDTSAISSNYTSEFYEQLYDLVDETISADILFRAAEDDIVDIDDVNDAILNEQSSEFILELDIETTEQLPTDVLTKIVLSDNNFNSTVVNDQWILKGDPYPSLPNDEFGDFPSMYDYRYISLGALVQYVNKKVLSKTNGASSIALPIIMCNEFTTTSNYYPSLVSANPQEILLLPKNTTNPGDMNSYGKLSFYQKITDIASEEWPGVYETVKSNAGDETTVVYPSRILINLFTIKALILELSNLGRSEYNVKTFLQNISAKIFAATGGAIELKLVSHPTLQDALLFCDVTNIKPIPDTKNEQKPVDPYSVPMFANHPNGSICQSFNFSAKIPENAKNLAYVLNSSDAISESQIAPFLNFMYTAGSGDVDKINAFVRRYEKTYISKLAALDDAKEKFGNEPTDDEPKLQLKKALFDHLKFPSPKLSDSGQMSAPVFPFEASFTIAGCNGLRYGDVVVFNALPKRYKTNTVFSIIGLTHQVSNSGVWTTEVKCIMRPNIL